MSYNEMVFAHVPCGFGVVIGKTLIGDWSISAASADAMERLTKFVAFINDEEIRGRYYDSQVRPGDEEESFQILTGNTFGKTWTTPSGTMFNWRDLVVPSMWHAPTEALAEGPRFTCEDLSGVPTDLTGIFQLSMLPADESEISIDEAMEEALERWLDYSFEHDFDLESEEEGLENSGQSGPALYQDDIVEGGNMALGRRGIYRGAALTMIHVDTQSDSNQFLRLFRNENEVFTPGSKEALAAHRAKDPILRFSSAAMAVRAAERFAVSMPPTSSAARPGIISVSLAGNDTFGDGTVEKPYRTLAKAIDVAVDGQTIRVSAGTFDSPPPTTKRLTIVGSPGGGTLMQVPTGDAG